MADVVGCAVVAGLVVVGALVEELVDSDGAIVVEFNVPVVETSETSVMFVELVSADVVMMALKVVVEPGWMVVVVVVPGVSCWLVELVPFVVVVLV